MNICCKFGVADQPPRVFDYLGLHPLGKDGVAAALTVFSDTSMPAGVVGVLLHTALDFNILFGGVHGTPTLGAFQHTNEQILLGTANSRPSGNPGIFCWLTLQLGFLKQFLADNRLMGSIADNIVVRSGNAPVFTSFIGDDLLPGPAIRDLANVNGIGQNPHDLFQGPVGEPFGCNRRVSLGNALLVQVPSNVGVAHILIHKFVKNQAYNAGFFLVDLQNLIFTALPGIAKGGNPAVPPALFCFLPSAQHRLCQDILTLHLRDCAKNGNQDFPHGGAAVQAILFA